MLPFDLRGRTYTVYIDSNRIGGFAPKAAPYLPAKGDSIEDGWSMQMGRNARPLSDSWLPDVRK